MRLLFAAALLLLTLPAAADGPTLTWEDCVGLAARQSPDLQAASYFQQAGRSAYLGSYNGVLPSVNVTNSYADTNLAVPGYAHWQEGLSASVNLFSASQLAAIRSAAASADRAASLLRQASTDLRLNLRGAFLQLLLAQESVSVGRRILELRARDAEMVTLRYDSGTESKGNMMRAKAQRVQAEEDLNTAIRQVRTAQRALGRYLGYEDFRAFVASGTLGAAGAVPELPSDFEMILTRRPDVATQEAVVRVSKASLFTARSPLFPSLTANYSRNASGTAEIPNANWGWTATGVLSLPVFGAGPTAAYFGVRGAKQSLEKSGQDLRITRGNAILDVENSWSGYASATASARVQADLLESARQRNDEADVRYASGLLIYDNWEIIASDRINQERQALQSRFSAASSEAGWDHALGRGLSE